MTRKVNILGKALTWKFFMIFIKFLDLSNKPHLSYFVSIAMKTILFRDIPLTVMASKHVLKLSFIDITQKYNNTHGDGELRNFIRTTYILAYIDI